MLRVFIVVLTLLLRSIAVVTLAGAEPSSAIVRAAASRAVEIARQLPSGRSGRREAALSLRGFSPGWVSFLPGLTGSAGVSRPSRNR